MGHGHDDWFRHDASEMAPQDEHGGHVDTGSLAITMVVTTFGVIATILLLVMYFQQYTTQLRAEKQEGIFLAEDYLAYRSQADGTLNAAPRWVNRDEGTVRLSIGRAMEAVVAEYERYPKAASGMNEQPEPAALPLIWDREAGTRTVTSGE